MGGEAGSWLQPRQLLRVQPKRISGGCQTRTWRDGAGGVPSEPPPQNPAPCRGSGVLPGPGGAQGASLHPPESGWGHVATHGAGIRGAQRVPPPKKLELMWQEGKLRQAGGGPRADTMSGTWGGLGMEMCEGTAFDLTTLCEDFPAFFPPPPQNIPKRRPAGCRTAPPAPRQNHRQVRALNPPKKAHPDTEQSLEGGSPRSAVTPPGTSLQCPQRGGGAGRGCPRRRRARPQPGEGVNPIIGRLTDGGRSDSPA